MQLKKIFLCFGIGAISSLLLSCGQEENTELLGNFKLDVPIVYVKRVLDDIDDGQDPDNAIRYKPGGHLYIREFASPNAREFNITANIPFYPNDPVPDTAFFLREIVNGNNIDRQAGDVATPEVSYDGRKIVFAVREGDYRGRMAAQQPKWELWEYVLEDGDAFDEGHLQAVITDTSISARGNDIDPVYLPDGRIVFTSDRNSGKDSLTRSYVGIEIGGITDEPLQNETGGEPVFNLHRINPADQSIEQISFNASHELNPSILSNGQVVYTRWENFQFPGGVNKNQFDLFAVNPDGTESNVLYGAHSHQGSAPVFLNAKEMQDGRLVVNFMPITGSFRGGDIYAIEYKNYVDVNTVRPNATPVSSSGQVSLTNNAVSLGGGFSARGRFTSPYPLWDGTNRLVVAWAPCEAEDVNGVRRLCTLPGTDLSDPDFAAPPAYGIWIYDTNTKTQRNIVLPQQGMTITDPVPLVDRFDLGNYPAAIADKNPDATLAGEYGGTGAGRVEISSIYDTSNLNNVGLDGFALTPEQLLCSGAIPCTAGAMVDLAAMQTVPLAERPVRYVRVSWAPFIFGRVDNDEDMRQIIGYQEVEADGSVVMNVPANWPFTIELVDAQGRKFRTHRNWLQVKSGHTVQCRGCHENHSSGTALNNQSPTLAEQAYVADIGVTDLYPYLDSAIPGLDHANLVYPIAGTNPVLASGTLAPRTIIDYETHIQPLWEKLRPSLGNASCESACHREDHDVDRLVPDPVDPVNNPPILITVNEPKVPDGQLSLIRAGFRTGDNNEITSYVELVTDDQLMVTVPDPNDASIVIGIAYFEATPGDDTTRVDLDDCNFNLSNDDLCDQPVRHSANGRADGSFINKFFTAPDPNDPNESQTVDHTGMLEPIELLLIQEWIDLGARYTGNPVP